MRLTNEAAQHFLIFTFKHFNGHLAVKVWVVPLVDISHSASTHQPVQLIATKCFPLQSYHKLSPSTSAKRLSGCNKSEPLQSFFGYIVYKTVHMFFCYVYQSSCATKRAPNPTLLDSLCAAFGGGRRKDEGITCPPGRVPLEPRQEGLWPSCTSQY